MDNEKAVKTTVKVGWYGWVDVDDPKGYGWGDVDPKGKVGVHICELVTAGAVRRHERADIPEEVADDMVMLSLRSGRFKHPDLFCLPDDFTPDPRAFERVGGYEDDEDMERCISEARTKMVAEGWQADKLAGKKEPKKLSVEELLLALFRTRYGMDGIDGRGARLLLIMGEDYFSLIERIADSTTDAEVEQFESHEKHLSDALEQLDAMTPYKIIRKLTAEKKRRDLQLISTTKATLIKKIQVLMARGYVPVGIVVPLGSRYTQKHDAGYMSAAEVKHILAAYASGFSLADNLRSDIDDDLGTVNRAHQDLEIV